VYANEQYMYNMQTSLHTDYYSGTSENDTCVYSYAAYHMLMSAVNERYLLQRNSIVAQLCFDVLFKPHFPKALTRTHGITRPMIGQMTPICRTHSFYQPIYKLHKTRRRTSHSYGLQSRFTCIIFVVIAAVGTNVSDAQVGRRPNEFDPASG
jgi:hypothetical protein